MSQPLPLKIHIQTGRTAVEKGAESLTTVADSVPGIDNVLTETARAGNTANCSVSVSVFHQGMRISGSVQFPPERATSASL